MRLGGPLGWSGHFGEDKAAFPCRELNLGLSSLYPVHCSHYLTPSLPKYEWEDNITADYKTGWEGVD